MTLDTSLPALLDATGGLAFVIVGALAFFSRGGEGRTRLALGFTSVTFGVAFVFINILLPDSVAAVAIVSSVAGLATVCALALAWEVARPLAPRERGGLAVGTLATLALLAWGAFEDRAPAGRAFGAPAGLVTMAGASVILLGALSVAVCAVVAAAGFRARGSERGLALLGLGLGLFPVLNGARLLALPISTQWLQPVSALVSVATLACWLPSRPRVAWAFVGAALVGLAVGLASRGHANANFDFGVNGIVRTFAALLLALAILRERALGIEPPDAAARRGPLAAGALAMLFIVAQVAQNFFAATYGLLVGSVVAGAFLFAASPIQRTLESRRAERDGRAPAATRDRARRVYKDAARHALRDRRMTRAEEVHLTELAEELGLPPSEALHMRHEVEDEPGERS